MQSINVGVRFQPVGEDGPNIEEGTFKKHWVLVFLPKSKDFVLSFEAKRAGDDDNDMILHPGVHSGSYDVYPVATYQGEWADLIKVLEHHPQRDSKFNVCFNNCQNFVATYLLVLEAFAKSTEKRSITIDYPSRYENICKVLSNPYAKRMWNDANIGMDGLHLASTGIAAVTTSAATATVRREFPAPGLAGFFGATVTVEEPTWYAGLAALFAPVAASISNALEENYMKDSDEWKFKTTFDNPLVRGFPTGYRRALSSTEKGGIAGLLLGI